MNRFALFALGATAVVASCSVAGDGELEQIDPADLVGLDETTTSTTTTSTVAIVTATSPVEPTFAATTTTVATEQVNLYFVDGSQLAAVPIDLVRGPSPSRVVAALLVGPPEGPAGIGLRSRLPGDLVIGPVVDSGAGFVTVDMRGDAFQRIDPADQRTAIGQLVLTLTERPGVGQVRFTLDGVPLRVPRLDGLQSEPGEAVSRLDYQSLLDVGGPDATAVTEAPATTTDSTPPPSAPGL